MGLPKIKIMAEPGMTPTVTLRYDDGPEVELLGLTAVGVRALPGEIPTVQVHFSSPLVSFEGDGIVEVIKEGEPQIDGQVIAGFLANMDPGELERVALLGASASTSLTGIMLGQLMRWALGDDNVKHPSEQG